MKKNNDYIKNLKFNERKFAGISFALVLAGSGLIASPKVDNINGLLLIAPGIYCTQVAQEYRNMIEDYILTDEKIKKLKK